MAQAQTIWLGNEQGLYRWQFDAGEVVQQTVQLTGRAVNDILPLPNRQTTLVATSTGLFGYSKDDETWAQLVTGWGWSLAATPNAERCWLGMEPVGLFTTVNAHDWQDIGAGLTDWDDWTAPALESRPRLKSMLSLPWQPDYLLAGIEIGGLLRSTDGGHSWQPVSEGLYEDDVQNLLALPQARVCLAGTADGLYRSLDGGLTWRESETMLARPYILAATATPDGCVWAAGVQTSPGYWIENLAGELYVSDDTGVNWRTTVLPQPGAVTTLTTDSRGVLWVGMQDGSVWRLPAEEDWQPVGRLSETVTVLRVTATM